MTSYAYPGIYIRNRVLPVPTQSLRTGVPLFVGLVNEMDRIRAQDGRFATESLSGDRGGPWVVRSTRVRAQLSAKTQPIRSRRQNDVAGYFLAEFPESSLEDDASLDPDDPWIVNKNHPERFTLWSEFEEAYRSLLEYGFLGNAVRGFFANGGRFCRLQMVSYLPSMSPLDALTQGLRTMESTDDIDLICVPDIMWLRKIQSINSADAIDMQNQLLEHCDRQNDRFAILDPLPGALLDDVKEQRAKLRASENGALYYPFIGVAAAPRVTDTMTNVSAAEVAFVPPCGHIAGIYARTDEKVGVFKAPANEVLNGVLQLEALLTDVEQGELNPLNINGLRSFPTRGIRVWGARTLGKEEEWRYVNVRRLFITVGRWIERNMMGDAFEPNNADLRARIRRDLTVYFDELFQRGALYGNTADEAYYIKCDADNNPKSVSDAGMVITDVGLAAAAPAEFIVVRIIADVTGVNILGPNE